MLRGSEISVTILFQFSAFGSTSVRLLTEMLPSRHKLFNGVYVEGKGAPCASVNMAKPRWDWRNLEFRLCLVNFVLLLYLTC
jgi:hypothetical protein